MDPYIDPENINTLSRLLYRERESPIQTIIDTIDDYLQKDVKGHLLETYYRKLVMIDLNRSLDCDSIS
jgi:hypothetical protein